MNLCVLGDFCPRGEAQAALPSPPTEIVDEAVLREIRDADFSIVNLECALTRSQTRTPKIGPKLKAPPEWAALLADMGFRMATLANNHTYDFGRQGLQDTLDACAKAGLETVGAGTTLDASRQTWFGVVANARLAVVNVADNEWGAATRRRGGAHPMNTIENARAIRDAAERADLVLVIAHGGNELCPYPSPNTVQRYRFFVENGAHAVVAHHPHVIQGSETYHGAPIVYSLGNFLFPPGRGLADPVSADRWTQGMGVRLRFPFTGPDCLHLFPFHQCVDGPKVVSVTAEEAAHFQQRLADLSAPISDPDALEQAWKEPLFAQASTLLWYLSFGSLPMQIVRRVLARLRLLGPLTRRRDRKNHLRLQLLRTECHRELVVASLKDLFRDDES